MATAGPRDLLRSGAHWLRHHRLVQRAAAVTLAVGTATAMGIGYEALLRARLAEPSSRQPTALYTRPTAWGSEDGQRDAVLIGTLESGLAEYRVPVRLGDVPDRLISAVLAVEDQRFYDHWGLDLWRIGGAAVANIRSGSIAQGGSTITQQLAKNLFLSARRTPLRKLREAAMALALEDRYDKDTILEAYLNEIYLGQDGPRAIRGVGAASRYYFGADVSEVTLGEAALLAGMIRAPNRYRPDRHPADARARRDLVLRLMAEQARVPEAAARRSARERVRSRPHPQTLAEAPWFRDFVRQRLDREIASLPARGASVFTTLDARLQRSANRAVAEGLRRSPAGAQAALVALDPRTGDILAMVGGRDYKSSQFNRAADAPRQPGSAFKPVAALAALARQDDGPPAFTLASVIRDEPISVTTPAGQWQPANYDRDFRGEVTFRDALEQSLNVPFARIGLAIGPERIVAAGRTLGITSPLRPVPSLALGTSEVTPLELTRAYGVFATGGYRADIRTVLGTARPGRIEWLTAPPPAGPAVDPAVAYLVTSALEGVITRGTGRALAGLGEWGGLAGKSGTSDNWRDAWFVAYTTTLVVGVWVGYDDQRSLRRTGAAAALPIVSRFLRDAFRVQGPEPFPIPDGVEEARAEGPSARWGNWWGCDGPVEMFLEGTAPERSCAGREGDG
ncbi:MAG TPA: PBP1A family penicillin-binding protein, partial [Gemmatimonadales bacterium]|nr:PBP1A family penicillin-binding protein [Gemmatimonadales bacterium]